MSLGVFIDCDVCSDTLTAGPIGTGSVIRREARQHGWHVGLQGGIDICDLCWELGFRASSVATKSHDSSTGSAS